MSFPVYESSSFFFVFFIFSCFFFFQLFALLHILHLILELGNSQLKFMFNDALFYFLSLWIYFEILFLIENGFLKTYKLIDCVLFIIKKLRFESLAFKFKNYLMMALLLLSVQRLNFTFPFCYYFQFLFVYCSTIYIFSLHI